MKPISAPNKEEFAALLEACSPDTNIGVRNRAILSTLYWGALRSQELVDLLVKDFEPAKRRLTITRGKGGKLRIVGTPQPMIDTVSLWLAKREKLEKLNGCKILFPTLRATKLATAYLRQMLYDHCEKAGIKQYSPHSLRHAAAINLMNEGFGVTEIQNILGHSLPATTLLYLSRLNIENVLDRQAQLRGRGGGEGATQSEGRRQGRRHY